MVDTYYQDMAYTFSLEEVSHALGKLQDPDPGKVSP
jgi:hypothetical protein